MVSSDFPSPLFRKIFFTNIDTLPLGGDEHINKGVRMGTNWLDDLQKLVSENSDKEPIVPFAKWDNRLILFLIRSRVISQSKGGVLNEIVRHYEIPLWVAAVVQDLVKSGDISEEQYPLVVSASTKPIEFKAVSKASIRTQFFFFWIFFSFFFYFFFSIFFRKTLRN